MKDLKSLKPTEIKIYTTRETFYEIVRLLVKYGGVEADAFRPTKDDGDNTLPLYISQTGKVLWDLVGIEELTEITLEQLRELAGVKEHQTERITLKDTGWMPTFREEANEHLKQLLTFQTDLNEHINSVVQKLATLEAVKSENESLKDCLKDVKDHFSDGDENTLEALLIKIDTLLK